jgi:hypothetical protein
MKRPIGVFLAGLLFGSVMFALLVGTLLLSGDLSASKFIYVDF